MTSNPNVEIGLARRLLGVFMTLSAFASCLVLLWMGSQPRLEESSWFVSTFWDGQPFVLVFSALLLGAGVQTSVRSTYPALAISLLLMVGGCFALRLWQWPALTLVLILSAACATLVSERHTVMRRWLGLFGLCVALWWMMVAVHEYHVRTSWAASNESPEVGLAALMAALAVATGISAAMLRFGKQGSHTR